jgi:hypothetical protein
VVVVLVDVVVVLVLVLVVVVAPPAPPLDADPPAPPWLEDVDVVVPVVCAPPAPPVGVSVVVSSPEPLPSPPASGVRPVAQAVSAIAAAKPAEARRTEQGRTSTVPPA